MEKKTDLRVMRSKQAIRTAFLHQLEERGYNAITIQGLTEEAMINRNTFYLHYENKQMLMLATSDECLHQLESRLKSIEKPLPNPASVENWLRALIEMIFRCVDEDFLCYRAFLHACGNFSVRLQKDFESALQEVFPKKHEGYIASGFLADGLVGALRFYTSNREDPSDIIRVVTQLCLDGTAWLFSEKSCCREVPSCAH